MGNGKQVLANPDPLGYFVKVSAKAEDQAGILRIYVDGYKDKGYYDSTPKAEDNSDVTKSLNDNVAVQQGQEKTFTVIAIDKFGNKANVEHKEAKTSTNQGWYRQTL